MMQPPNFQQFIMQNPHGAHNPFMQNPQLAAMGAFNPIMLSGSGGILTHPAQSYLNPMAAPVAAATNAGTAAEASKAPE